MEVDLGWLQRGGFNTGVLFLNELRALPGTPFAEPALNRHQNRRRMMGSNKRCTGTHSRQGIM